MPAGRRTTPPEKSVERADREAIRAKEKDIERPLLEDAHATVVGLRAMAVEERTKGRSRRRARGRRVRRAQQLPPPVYLPAPLLLHVSEVTRMKVAIVVTASYFAYLH